MDINIKDKVFLVAASSKGLGYGIARELALNGAMVSIGSRDTENVEQAAQTLRQETNTPVYASTL
ncbi:MAG TPA: SDR family NAD(P)-dependent oxidoreductase, partial [Mariniphaga sp.]|nr:SDR family NAD(P)-dependent oxidoreductase [Mariniphaga sp.]